MAASVSPNQPRGFFWRVTHPREMRRLRREEEHESDVAQQAKRVQEARETIRASRQNEEKWLGVARNPNATGDELRGAICDEGNSWMESWRAAYRPGELSILEDTDTWHQNFERTVTAHPNFPPEMLGRELEVNESTVEGLLRNPALSLILLESPGFIEALDQDNTHPHDPYRNQRSFVHFALQQEVIPPMVFRVLAETCDPWLTLEGRTHIASQDPDVPVKPDLDWLNTQVINLLRADTLFRRCLVYELAYHGLLPKDIESILPWRSESSISTNLTPGQGALELVREMSWMTKWKPRERQQKLDTWIEEMVYQEEIDDVFTHLEIVMLHPEIPGWARRYIYDRWVCREEEFRYPLQRLMVILQGKVTPTKIRQLRASAIQATSCSWNGFTNSCSYCSPGIFYMTMRDLPEVLTGATLNPKYNGFTERYSPSDIRNTSFLVRLVVALRLEKANPKHKEWREILCSDPNRYVRAAARKEIVWQKTAG